MTAQSCRRFSYLSPSGTHSRDPTALSNLHRTVGLRRYCTEDAQHEKLINAEIPHVDSSMSSENLKFQLLDVIEAIFNTGGQAVLDRLRKCSSTVLVALGAQAAMCIWIEVISQM